MDPVNPASLNRYSYVGNNPLLYTDSDGHCWPLCTAAIGAVAGAIVGAASVALPQMIQNVRDGQPLTASIDPSQVATAAGIGAVSGAVAGATFGAGMAAGGAIAGAVGISSASGVSATAVGLTTVAVSGVAAGQTGRATANLMTGQSVSQGLFQPGDMALDAATSAVGFRLSGGGFNRIAPSHVAHPGSFARGSIQATGPKATPGQRQAIQELGPCHHCGTSNPGGNGRMIADHIPPNSLANGAQQQLYPQCRSCMGHQADYLRHYSRSPLVRPQRLPFGTLGATLFSPPIDLE